MPLVPLSEYSPIAEEPYSSLSSPELLVGLVRFRVVPFLAVVVSPVFFVDFLVVLLVTFFVDFRAPVFRDDVFFGEVSEVSSTDSSGSSSGLEGSTSSSL